MYTGNCYSTLVDLVIVYCTLTHTVQARLGATEGGGGAEAAPESRDRAVDGISEQDQDPDGAAAPARAQAARRARVAAPCAPRTEGTGVVLSVGGCVGGGRLV